jgi:hypothetical protein
MSDTALRITKVATPCAFDDCPFLAVPGEGAVALAAGGIALLVCDRCRAALERGRSPGTAASATAVDGSVHRVFLLADPEARA